METQIKKAVKSGNSSAVILPRAWLNKEVRIELVNKSSEMILEETLEIAKKHLELESVIGIYLVGSYARKEEDKDSDIDILIITDNIDKNIVHEGIYSILIVSYQLIEQKLKRDIFPIGPMLKEAKSLLNSAYLKSLNIKVTKENVQWYLDTTAEKLILIEKILEGSQGKKDSFPSDLAYTLILRLRTLYIIQSIIKDKIYSKKQFLAKIKSITGSEKPYLAYLGVKNNEPKMQNIDLLTTQKLTDFLKKELELTKRLIKERV